MTRARLPPAASPAAGAPARVPARAPDGPPDAARAVVDLGLARDLPEARAWLSQLAAALSGAGFGAGPAGVGGRGLAAALRQFQVSQGLPPTGMLDSPTLQRLRERGLVRASPAASGVPGGKATQGPAPGGALRPWRELIPVATAAPRDAGASGQAHSSAVLARDLRLLGDLRLGAPGTGPGAAQGGDLGAVRDTLSALGFVGTGRGPAQLMDALRRFRAAQGLPPAAGLDAATLRALSEHLVASWSPDARYGASPASPASPEAPSSPALAHLREEASAASAAPFPSAGAEERAGTGKSGRGGEGGVAPLGDAAGRYASAGASDPRGEVEDDANAPAGDEERDDPRRGHATLDDGEHHEEGYYEIPALAEQLREALEAVVRHERARGPVTYAWDVTFYRPGVYGRRQPAEPLWHLAIEDAAPFDPIWEEAHRALASRLASVEPDAPRFTPEHLRAALRRARMRAPRDPGSP